ncbi:MAG: PhoH family protein, partial [Oscillospiraceae bacterium]
EAGLKAAIVFYSVIDIAAGVLTWFLLKGSQSAHTATTKKNPLANLIEAVKVLKNIKGIETVQLTDKDVVRNRLIQDIIKAYETYYDGQHAVTYHKRRE